VIEYQAKNGRWYVRFSTMSDAHLIERFGKDRMFRSHFVYCCAHGLSSIPENCVIHHNNRDKSDDSLSNLTLLGVDEHIDIHKVENAERASKVHRGRKCSQKTIERMRSVAGRRGNNGMWESKVCHSKETKKKMSELQAGKDNSCFRSDIDPELVRLEYFEEPNIAKISDKFGCSNIAIRNRVQDLNDGCDIEWSEVLSIEEDGEDDVYDIQMEGNSPSFVANGVVVHNCGMQSLLRGIECSTFDMATDTTALFRPGSLNSGQTAQYVRIAKGDEDEDYETPLLKPILGPTKGILVYQEQIMQIFVQLGGFSWAGADKMRKIIGKKLGKDEFEKHRAGFVDGCVVNGIDANAASSLFDKMAEFAAYSFNKSHAVAYTMLSFWSMYLKAHFPAEFFAAQLGNSSDERITLLSREAERCGIRIRLPDVNLSTDEYVIDEDGAIVPPLGIVKGIGTKAVEEILRARSDGAFLSEADFLSRVQKRQCNSRVHGALVRAGGFESLGVREDREEERVKNFSELLPTYNNTPKLAKGGGNLNLAELKSILTNSAVCASTAKRKYLMPVFPQNTAKPSIMIINNPVKREYKHLTADSTKFLVTELKEVGILARDIYYTSPVKCFFDPKGSPAQPTKECEGKCTDYLRQEIVAVGPKIIVCFASSLVHLFTGDKKAKMSSLQGQVIYSKQFGCYVLFSCSPQFAFFSEGGENMDKFRAAIQTLGGIFK